MPLSAATYTPLTTFARAVNVCFFMPAALPLIIPLQGFGIATSRPLLFRLNGSIQLSNPPYRLRDSIMRIHSYTDGAYPLEQTQQIIST